MRPHKGRVIFNDEQSPFVTTSWKKLIGYVPQDPVFPQNVNALQTARFLSRLYPKWSDCRFREMSNAFQLPVKRKLENYSFGMKTMLSVALAFACDPALYILDEPTSGLDPVSRRIVLDLIKQENVKGKSVIFSTHIVGDLYDNCDYLGIIDNGIMLYEGSIKKIASGKGGLEENYFQLIKYKESNAS